MKRDRRHGRQIMDLYLVRELAARLGNRGVGGIDDALVDADRARLDEDRDGEAGLTIALRRRSRKGVVRGLADLVRPRLPPTRAVGKAQVSVRACLTEHVVDANR